MLKLGHVSAPKMFVGDSRVQGLCAIRGKHPGYNSLFRLGGTKTQTCLILYIQYLLCCSPLLTRKNEIVTSFKNSQAIKAHSLSGSSVPMIPTNSLS